MNKQVVLICPFCGIVFKDGYMQECPECRKNYPNEEFIFSLEYAETTTGGKNV